MSTTDRHNRGTTGDADRSHATRLPCPVRRRGKSSHRHQPRQPQTIQHDPATPSTAPHNPIAHRPPRILNIQSVFEPAILPAKLDLSADRLQAAGRLAYLYDVIFADHPEWLDAAVLWAQEPQRMGEDIELFLERVSAERFPVYTYIEYLSDDELNIPLYSVPIEPMGFSYWYGGWEQFENYKEPVRFLAAIQMREFIEEEDSEQLMADNYPDLTVPRDMDLSDLLPVLAEMDLPDPINGLPDMIRWIQATTENPWLDICAEEMAEMGMEDHWENWKALTDDWREAKPILDRIYALLNWMHPKDDQGNPLYEQTRFDIVWQTIQDAYNRLPTYLLFNQQRCPPTTRNLIPSNHPTTPLFD